jgi:putative iron-regulated protein
MVRTRLWVGLGVAVLAQSGLPALDEDGVFSPIPAAYGQEGGGEGGEGGEGAEGGEGGGALPDSYALASRDPDAFKYDAAPQVASYAALVRASYLKAAAEAGKLQAAVDAFLADPTEATLAAARAAWVNARPAYLETEAFRFYDGPIEAVEGQVNAWPMNEAFIDGVADAPDSGIVHDATLTIDAETLIGANQVTDETDVTTGWHAIEFLLWGQDLSATGPGARPAAEFVADGGDNDRRRTYLKVVTDLLVENIAGVAAAWDPAAPDGYAATFLALPQREAVGRIVNGVAQLAGFELMSERLAVSLDSGDQEDEHSCFSDTTRQDFIYDLRGIRNVWVGHAADYTGSGLRDLVAGQFPELAVKIDGLVFAAETAADDIDAPFDQVLASPPGSASRAEAEALVAAFDALGQGLKDAGNKLGVLVQLAD